MTEASQIPGLGPSPNDVTPVAVVPADNKVDIPGLAGPTSPAVVSSAQQPAPEAGAHVGAQVGLDPYHPQAVPAPTNQVPSNTPYVVFRVMISVKRVVGRCKMVQAT